MSSGNSRGLFEPRVPGGQWETAPWGMGAGPAFVYATCWTAQGSNRAPRCALQGNGRGAHRRRAAIDEIVDIDHARDGEVMLAFQMNGEQLPLLNGFPLRLIVPGWYSTYWVKMLNDIEILDGPDDNYWMKTAYRIPDTPHASVKPGEKGFATVPINRMVPRSFFTNLKNGETVKPGTPPSVRGIAFGGDCGVAEVQLSDDGGTSWRAARLGPDQGKYGFRRWSAEVRRRHPGR